MARGTWPALILLAAAPVLGQAPVFDAASVKPSTADPSTGSTGSSGKGRFSIRNATLRRLIRGAYDVPETRVVGGPKWLDEEHYDVEAKAAAPVDDPELMQMLRTLLADRFHLVVHRETRTLSAYALVLAKGGITAKPSDPDTGSRTSASRGRIDAHAASMEQLAQKLSDALHVPVTDLTATSGKFDFDLKWTYEDLQAKAPPASAELTGPSIFTALQEQLGLKLEPRKIPVEVVVVDTAAKPSQN